MTGRLLTTVGQFREASSYFETSIKLDRTQADAWEGLAKAALSAGLLKKAIRSAKTALSLDSSRRPRTRFWATRIYQKTNWWMALVRTNRPSNATPGRKKFIGHSFTLAVRYGVLQERRWTATSFGFFYSFLGFHREELDERYRPTCLSKGLFPFFEAKISNRSFCSFLKRYFLSSETIYRRKRSSRYMERYAAALECHQSHKIPSHCLNSLGKIFYRIHKFDDCETAFKRILEHSGPNENSYYYLAACSEIRKDFLPALRNYKKARAIRRLRRYPHGNKTSFSSSERSGGRFADPLILLVHQ